MSLLAEALSLGMDVSAIEGAGRGAIVHQGVSV